MERTPWRRVWRLYAAVLGVLTLAVGALMIWQSVVIYQAGIAPENISAGVYIHPVYSQEIVAEHFAVIAVPVYIYLACIVLGLGMWLAHPAEAPRPRPFCGPEETLRKLRPALADQPQAVAAMDKERRLRRIVRGIEGAVIAVCAAISADYLLREEHFSSWDLESVMADMMLAVVPWVVLAFAVACAASEICGRSAAREIVQGKNAAVGKKPVDPPDRHSRCLPAVRIVLYAAAVALVVLGILNGGMRDVLIKAINICTECIGLG